MRVIHLRVALGMLVIGSAVASPCKPFSATTTSAVTSDAIISTTETSDASTATSLATSHASTTDDEGATSSTVVESSTETLASSAETSAATTTTVYTAETTTAEPTTTDATTTVAETTSSAAIATFTMFASGSNAVAGSSLETYNRDGTLAVFDPATEDDNPSARQYSIDSQGRIVNDLGWYLCGYYGATNEELNKPATVVTCYTQTVLQTAFLTCTWSLNSVGVRAFGHTWQIGGSDTPANYERMTMSIREVRA
ncbi:hypothetical protein FPANT_8940 [Fusarium pseudoanthophilum]|uniref:Uncharacterized protein n=1 Tax=Fusarium pseudoanthophilum TaxID=48495 RepID=A0A8H5KYC9_9HYPO|nr:hypothetical protein FPANT_8940 [Fusarium pseudoanthophilum]